MCIQAIIQVNYTNASGDQKKTLSYGNFRCCLALYYAVQSLSDSKNKYSFAVATQCKAERAAAYTFSRNQLLLLVFPWYIIATCPNIIIPTKLWIAWRVAHPATPSLSIFCEHFHRLTCNLSSSMSNRLAMIRSAICKINSDITVVRVTWIALFWFRIQ